MALKDHFKEWGVVEESDTTGIIERVKDHQGNPLRLFKKRKGYAKDKNVKDRRKPFSKGRIVWGQRVDYPDSVLVIEEMVWDQNQKKELRFGYWTTTSDNAKHRKGVWSWGESAMMAPPDAIADLIQFAADRGLLTLKNPSTC